jgi:hypothetical protein
MKILRLIIFLVPLAIVFCIGITFTFIALLAGALDDGCKWLFEKMYHGK